MEVRAISLGGIYRIENDSVYKTDSRGHYYIALGQYNKSKVSMVQCMCITSMYGKKITIEIPIVFKGYVSYVTPYNIHSFPVKEFDAVSYAGGLSSDGIFDFIELLHDIHKDATLFGFENKNLHEDVKNRYNEYMKVFYSYHKNLREYRYDKYHIDELREDDSKRFEISYYCDESNEVSNAELDTDIRKKKMPIEPDFVNISDSELIGYYKKLKSMNASDFREKYSIETLDKRKSEKDVLGRMFYNSRHKAKNELMKRGLYETEFKN